MLPTSKHESDSLSAHPRLPYARTSSAPGQRRKSQILLSSGEDAEIEREPRSLTESASDNFQYRASLTRPHSTEECGSVHQDPFEKLLACRNALESERASRAEQPFRHVRAVSTAGKVDDQEYLDEYGLAMSDNANILPPGRHSAHNVRFGPNKSARNSLVREHPNPVEFSNERKGQWIFSNPFDDEAAGSRKSSSSSDFASYIRPGAFAGHRDTLARIRRPNTDSEASTAESVSSASTMIRRRVVKPNEDSPRQCCSRSFLPFPSAVIDRIIQFLSFEDYKLARLTCRSWLLSLPEPKLPGPYRVPGEVLQLIYHHLSPLDFDAARHVCKTWFLASLHTTLLLTMTRRAGAYAAARQDLRWREAILQSRRLSWSRHLMTEHAGRVTIDHPPELDDVVSEEWLCSKRLASEARLSPGGLCFRFKGEVDKTE